MNPTAPELDYDTLFHPCSIQGIVTSLQELLPYQMFTYFPNTNEGWLRRHAWSLIHLALCWWRELVNISYSKAVWCLILDASIEHSKIWTNWLCVGKVHPSVLPDFQRQPLKIRLPLFLTHLWDYIFILIGHTKLFKSSKHHVAKLRASLFQTSSRDIQYVHRSSQFRWRISWYVCFEGCPWQKWWI